MARKQQDYIQPEPVHEELFQLWSARATDEEVRIAICLIVAHLKVRVVRTNRTKHQNIEIRLEPEEREDGDVDVG